MVLPLEGVKFPKYFPPGKNFCITIFQRLPTATRFLEANVPVA